MDELAKKEAFENDPNRFVSLDELVCAIKLNNEDKIESFINTTKAKYFDVSLGLLINEIPFAKQYVQTREKIKDKNILTPSGNNRKFRNFFKK